MGTIRNRVTIVYADSIRAEELRYSAVKTFQELADKYSIFDVSEELISPIFTGMFNAECTFFINGDCSKLGWPESDEFEELRNKWCESNKDKAYDIIVVDFGEGYPAKMTEYKPADS